MGEARMKTKLFGELSKRGVEAWKRKLIGWGVVLLVCVVPDVMGIAITSVQILPDEPSTVDAITIRSEGRFPGGTLFYDASVFTMQGLSLQLDLYFTGGTGPQIPQPWWREDGIGRLSSGSYDVLVQAYWRASETASYVLHDDRAVDFEVVPEPGTLLLLAAGGLVALRRGGRTVGAGGEKVTSNQRKGKV
jgi:hypothetical protein